MTIEHCLSSTLRRLEVGPPPAATGRAPVAKDPVAKEIARRVARHSSVRSLAGACLAVLGLASCGGSNPLDNPPSVENTAVVGGAKLSFAYFQKCINPILTTALPIPGTNLTNTCSAGGCHSNATGSGGALRLAPAPSQVSLVFPLSETEKSAIRTTEDMYKNFLSAQGQVVFADPAQSRLVLKPLVQGVLHGGGRIFAGDQDPNILLILYWMSHPAAQGQDEFSTPTPITC